MKMLIFHIVLLVLASMFKSVFTLPRELVKSEDGYYADGYCRFNPEDDRIYFLADHIYEPCDETTCPVQSLGPYGKDFPCHFCCYSSRPAHHKKTDLKESTVDYWKILGPIGWGLFVFVCLSTCGFKLKMWLCNRQKRNFNQFEQAQTMNDNQDTQLMNETTEFLSNDDSEESNKKENDDVKSVKPPIQESNASDNTSSSDQTSSLGGNTWYKESLVTPTTTDSSL